MYRDWVERAVSFAESVSRYAVPTNVQIDVEQPLSAVEFEELQTQIPARIPAPIASFLTSASGSCRCDYVFTIQNEMLEIHRSMPAEFAKRLMQVHVRGGPHICNSEELAEWNGVDSKLVADDLTGMASEYWRHCFFFLAMTNGDYLGLDTREDPIDPPVVYVGHENEAFPVSSSFDSFLIEWEKTYYLDVNSLRDFEFVGRNGQLFDATRGRLQELEDLHSRAQQSAK